MDKINDQVMCANCARRNRRGFTPSMQMRHALFILHESNGGTEETFEEYYKDKMRSLTDMIISKLPPV